MMRTLSVAALLAASLSLGCIVGEEAEGENRRIAKTCDVVEGSGSGSVQADKEWECEACECPQCDNDIQYLAAYRQVFGQDPPGSGDGSGSGSNFRSDEPPNDVVPDDVIQQCLVVAKMTYSPTFNCKDFTTWFLRCLTDKGYTGTGLSMSCKNCTDKKMSKSGHRISILKRRVAGRLYYCPVEDGWYDGEIVTSCCRTKREDAEKCAHEKYCSGLWPSRHPDDPDPRFPGCEPDSTTQRTCAYCLNETCTDEEKELVCKLIEGVEPPQPDPDPKPDPKPDECDVGDGGPIECEQTL